MGICVASYNHVQNKQYFHKNRLFPAHSSSSYRAYFYSFFPYLHPHQSPSCLVKHHSLAVVDRPARGDCGTWGLFGWLLRPADSFDQLQKAHCHSHTSRLSLTISLYVSGFMSSLEGGTADWESNTKSQKRRYCWQKMAVNMYVYTVHCMGIFLTDCPVCRMLEHYCKHNRKGNKQCVGNGILDKFILNILYHTMYYMLSFWMEMVKVMAMKLCFCVKRDFYSNNSIQRCCPTPLHPSCLFNIYRRL